MRIGIPQIFSLAAFSAVFLFFLTGLSAHAQDTLLAGKKGLEKGQVQWKFSWPTEAAGKRSFWDVITGKKHEPLRRPISLWVEKDGDFWVLDQESKTILEVEEGVGKTPHFISKKEFGFNSLVGICRFVNGTYLVTDSYMNIIFLIDPQNKICKVWNDSLVLDKPTGIGWNSMTNEVWLTETGKHRIDILNNDGKIVRYIGMRGKQPGEFNFPTHLCIDAEGNAYVVDAMNFRVQIFNKDGELISYFGSNGDATGYFASPKGISVDSYGNIYIVDALFHAVQIFNMKGDFLYSFGAQGRGNGEFWMPNGIFIDEQNNIYVADSYNSRVQCFQLIPGGVK